MGIKAWPTNAKLVKTQPAILGPSLTSAPLKYKLSLSTALNSSVNPTSS